MREERWREPGKYNDKEGRAKAMMELAAALVTGEGMDKIELERRNVYIFLPYPITPGM